MIASANSLYRAYGAYRLKAVYQRNLLIELTMVTILAVASSDLFLSVTPPVHPTTTNHDGGTKRGPIRDTVHLAKHVRIVGKSHPTARVGIPVPVDDIAEIADMPVLSQSLSPVDLFTDSGAAFGSASDNGYSAGSGDLFGDSRYPARDAFVPYEIPPEMIYEAVPEYPRLAKEAGWEGTVWIAVLVDIDGHVRKAEITRSSGMPLLDDAALAAASRNRFSPAKQNGHAVAVWVTYRVDFVLNR
ncbi:MAG: energy transducer TonB [Candidatus Zixiibacteriota bacterium]|nr:MAG: energy transducer TonB [candidate division Zixibacteria bacterium]